MSTLLIDRTGHTGLLLALLVSAWAGCTSEGTTSFPFCESSPSGRFSGCPEPVDAVDAAPDDPQVDTAPVDISQPDADDPAPDPPPDLIDEPAIDLIEEPDLAADDGNAQEEMEEGPCPADMVALGEICMDRYEAPNVEGGLPFVMFHYREALDWCEARGKRLCYDDEWTLACGGTYDYAYPYGNTRQPGVCNDEEVWRSYNQDLLNLWPWSHETDDLETLQELYDRVSAVSSSAALAVDHIEALYQAEPSGSNTGCGGEYGIYDLTGNIEEWTTRRDGGGGPELHGNLKGRYWADTRTCQNNITGHGDFFRFYEIGFRCCQDQD